MGEIAKTVVSIKGPDAAHGIIPEALVKWERDDTYSAKKDANGYHVPEEHGKSHPARMGWRERERALTNLTPRKVYGKTTVVKDMHTRKQMMAQEVIEGGPGSGFIALSGGYGTMEELMETTTWNQLGIHDRGVCVLNIGGFYDGLLDWIRGAVSQGFVRGGNADILVTATDAKSAIQALADYRITGDRYPLTWENN